MADATNFGLLYAAAEALTEAARQSAQTMNSEMTGEVGAMFLLTQAMAIAVLTLAGDDPSEEHVQRGVDLACTHLAEITPLIHHMRQRRQPLNA